MKKILLLLILFIGSFFLFRHFFATGNTQAPIHVLAPTATPTPAVGKPISITIPALGVNAAVEEVGLDSQGRMGVPEQNMDTAWYKYGPLPGSKGSAVIDGHFDTPTGAPAVFYNISHLKRGDNITVNDSNGNTYTFTVVQVTSYPYDKLPMQEIFASYDKPRLNLITCDGVWNRAQHNYSNRVVVYAERTF